MTTTTDSPLIDISPTPTSNDTSESPTPIVDNTLSSHDELVATFMAVTSNQNEAYVRNLLSLCYNWNIDLAVNEYLAGRAPPEGTDFTQLVNSQSQMMNQVFSLESLLQQARTSHRNSQTNEPDGGAVQAEPEETTSPNSVDSNLESFSAIGNFVSNATSALATGTEILSNAVVSIPILGPIISSAGNYFMSHAVPISTQPSLSLEELESEFGNFHPDFLQCNYKTAIQKAKFESKVLFIYIHNPNGPGLNDFIKNIFHPARELHETTPLESIDSLVPLSHSVPPKEGSGQGKLRDWLLDNEFLSWMASTTYSEGSSLASALKVTRFPFIGAVIRTPSSRDVMVLRLSGYSSSSTPSFWQTLLWGSSSSTSTDNESMNLQIPQNLSSLFDKLTAVKNQVDSILGPARAIARDRDAERRLMQTQRDEYAQVLLSDKKRLSEEQNQAQKQRAAQEKKLSEAEEKRNRILELYNARKHRRAKAKFSLQPEPKTLPKAQITNLLIRLPDGSRLKRKFRITDTIQHVLTFLDVQYSLPIEYCELVTTSPPKTFSNHEQNLKDAGLSPRAVVFLQYRQDIDLDELDYENEVIQELENTSTSTSTTKS